MSARKTYAIAGAAAAALGVLTGVGYRRFQHELRGAQLRVVTGSAVADTASGRIEYAQQGDGDPLLIVHGAGGGFDQGLLFARGLVDRGFRVTAMSRFGYLRTPLPEDASAQAQADAHASLLDSLQIRETTVIGASAGAPSALQFAIRHPQRCRALVLLVPLTWAPGNVLRSVHRPARIAELMLRWLVMSDAVYWMALRVARGAVIETILGTPPSLVKAADRSEQARIDEVLRSVFPLSQRAAGLKNDARVAASLTRYALEEVRVPTLVIALRDDLYGMYAGAQYTAEHIPGARFVHYDHGGHLWVGHQDALLETVASFAHERQEAKCSRAGGDYRL
ncbi:alpha/beta fold hydrolase [Steroidobacter cummioxidans]|uniref:alpha/beta fold hydrolase n=1 Tax=Steroidobacter cummioxidans TaxID=1803913 RepID=UPI000E314952|nr:alpha/beta hydrolase [Steroidobacter cummioxidans]